MPLADAPRPQGMAVLRALTGLALSPVGTFRDLSTLGDVVRVPTPVGPGFYLLNRPEHAEHVLVRHQDDYMKASTYRPLRAILETGLLTSEGPQWRRHRRLIQPAFTRASVAGFAPEVAAGVERTLTRWEGLPDGATVDMNRETSALALDIVGRVLFGADLTGAAERLAGATAVLLPVLGASSMLGFLWVPRSGRVIRGLSRVLGGPVAALDQTVEEIIVRGRAKEPGGPSTMLDFLFAARDEDGSGLTDEEIGHEVATFMMTGHETTAVTLGWCLALLSTHPDARARLEREVTDVLGDRDPTAADVDKLAWTRAVVQEAMRLYPPAWNIERQAVRADVVDGVRIPAGSTVAISPFLLHRRRDIWPNPEGFDPARFLVDQERHRYAYIPFGGGRRACIGAGFAELEAVLTLAMLCRRYRIDLADAFPIPSPFVTIRPGRHLPMRLNRRGAA